MRGAGGRLEFQIFWKPNTNFLENQCSREQPEINIVDFDTPTHLALGRPRDHPLQPERKHKAKCDKHSKDRQSNPTPVADALQEIGQLGAQQLCAGRIRRREGQWGLLVRS